MRWNKFNGIGNHCIIYGTTSSGDLIISEIIISLGQFHRIKLPLFLSLVPDRLGSDLDYPDTVFGESFKLVPRLQSKHGISELRVEQQLTFLAFETDHFWKDVVLSAIDFYDWQELDFRDFRYFLARIEKFAAEPALVGSRALVEVGEVEVIWHPPGIYRSFQSSRAGA